MFRHEQHDGRSARNILPSFPKPCGSACGRTEGMTSPNLCPQGACAYVRNRFRAHPQRDGGCHRGRCLGRLRLSPFSWKVWAPQAAFSREVLVPQAAAYGSSFSGKVWAPQAAFSREVWLPRTAAHGPSQAHSTEKGRKTRAATFGRLEPTSTHDGWLKTSK